MHSPRLGKRTEIGSKKVQEERSDESTSIHSPRIVQGKWGRKNIVGNRDEKASKNAFPLD